MSEKTDAERLMNELLPLAERMLEEFGEFLPYGGYIKRNGDVVHVGVDLPTLTSREKFDAIVSNLQYATQSGAILVAAVVTNNEASTEDDGHVDAIRMLLEHSEGYCADVYHLYKIVDGKPVYLRVSARQGKGLLFKRLPD